MTRFSYLIDMLLADLPKDIIYRDPGAEVNLSEVKSSKSGDGLTLLGSLISNINSKQTPKRTMFSNLPFEIAPSLRISVKGYNVIHREVPKRSCYIWLDGERPQIASGETTKIAEDSARTVAKTEIKKAYKFGGEYVYFTPEEQKSLKDFGSPAIRIIGFKKRQLIPFWASVKKSTFLYPSEEDYVGSTRVFTALWQKLLRDEKVGIAWYVPRVNAVPIIVAVVPSKEKSDEESGTQYLASGLWLYPLPFVDDIRDGPEIPAVNSASNELVDQMRAIVQQLQLPKGIYSPSKYPNPALQWFYKILQALALEEEVPENPEDATLPKYKAISKRAGGYLQEWKETLSQEVAHLRSVNKVKREAEEELVERPAKKAKAPKPSGSGLSNAQLKAAVDGGGLSKIVVADLKDLLASRGLSTIGKKAELMERLEQWAEENA
jgi:ATP-dependent DNA helicase 2 subunit 1